MDLSGSHFIYSGVSSHDYGLIFVNIKTERFNRMSGNIETNYIFNKSDKKKYYIGENYSDSPISFDAEVITENGEEIDYEYRHDIEKWLFHRPGFRKLYIDPEDDCNNECHQFVDGIDKYYYINCRFINPEKIESNGLIGYSFTVECDSCLMWQDPIVKTFDFTDGASDHTISIVLDTDIVDYTYPKITLKTGNSGGDISIINMSDEPYRKTSFINLTPNITFIMNGSTNYISGNEYFKFKDKNFIRVLDGDNTIKINGDISQLKFEFQNRRYL